MSTPHHHEHHEHHISTSGQLWAVCAALVFLTLLTVILGKYVAIPSPFDIVTALTIALVKASLVAAFFMNLYWDVKFNTILLITAVVFFLLMVSVTMLDTMFRNDVVPSF